MANTELVFLKETLSITQSSYIEIQIYAEQNQMDLHAVFSDLIEKGLASVRLAEPAAAAAEPAAAAVI
jgi:hypothetical protein